MRAWRLCIDASSSQAGPAKPAAETAQPLALPDKPSIAVLPFQNMSGDPEQEYFSDGMVEDIITGLSRSKSLFVIARNSTFTYKGKAVDIKQVGRELGVRYVLEGGVRKAANRIRITRQLIDATTGAHIWADKFDSELEDVFDLQDRVTSNVIGAISPQLERREIERAQRKPTENLQAYDYYLRALFYTYRFTREANIEALRLTKIATTIDPAFALAYARGGMCFTQRKGFGWSTDPAQETAETRRFAQRAIDLDKDDPSVLTIAGHGLAYGAEEVEEGAALLLRAINLDPNLASARFWSGWAQIYLGNLDAAIEQFQVAVRLSPLEPRIFLAQTGMAYAHFLAGRYEEGSSWASTALRQQTNFLSAQRIVMACHAMSGRIEEARQACALALQMDSTQRISGIKTRSPFRRQQDIEKLAEAFRIAGMPE
jgi:TolB-like protein